MAMWLKENNVLTTTGLEILAKLQAGIGEMKLTRVVSGAGFVASVDLINQTAVTNPMIECKVVAKETTKNGSGLELQLSNEGLMLPYKLYQIGIYVEHTDYVGEQLYLIAQCVTTHPDEIPSFDITPVVLNYSIFMAHQNADDRVEIIVDYSGYVLMSMIGRPLGVVPTDMQNLIPSQYIPQATTSSIGGVILYDGVDSYSTTMAATANAVRIAYENGGGSFSGDVDGGYFGEEEETVDTHNVDPHAHANMVVSGGYLEVVGFQIIDTDEINSLDEHKQDPDAHPHLIIDGSGGTTSLANDGTLESHVLDQTSHANLILDGGTN